MLKAFQHPRTRVGPTLLYEEGGDRQGVDAMGGTELQQEKAALGLSRARDPQRTLQDNNQKPMVE